MSPHLVQENDSPSVPVMSFGQLFFEVTAIISISTLAFTAIGLISPIKANALEANDSRSTIEMGTIDQSALAVSTSAEDLLSGSDAPLQIQLESLPSFDCLVAAAPKDRRFCPSYGPFDQILFDSVVIELQSPKPEDPSDRLELVEINFSSP